MALLYILLIYIICTNYIDIETIKNNGTELCAYRYDKKAFRLPRIPSVLQNI